MINRNKAICITGIGLVSVFGDTLQEFMAGLNSHQSTPEYIADEHIIKKNRIPVFEAPSSIKTWSYEEQLSSMGCKAICSALLDRKADNMPDRQRICLVVGSGMGFIDQYYLDKSRYDDSTYFCSLADKLAGDSSLNCETVYIGNACSAGSQAISYGMDLLESERYDLVIAGGIDIVSQAAYAGFLRLNAIDPDGCKPFDQRRKGIAIGEGAVFFTLERRADLETKRRIYCTLPGAGVTCDAYHIVQMRPDGTEIMRAMEQALSFAGLGREDVDLLVAHGTGTALNDRIESQILAKFFEDHLSRMHITAPKGAIGHTGGASGAFGVLTAICAIMSGKIPPVSNLETIDPECHIPLVSGKSVMGNVSLVMVNAFAFGGTNVVILCQSVAGDTG